MTKILFVCHGNICRSPMAEFTMKEIAKQRGIEGDFYIESAATSTEEIGNGVYPPVKRLLAARGISCEGKRARQIRRDDYDKFDYIICMDSYNIRNIKRIIPNDVAGKISLLMDHTNNPHDVADPWYTGDFKLTERDIQEGCEALIEKITAKA